MPSFRRNVNSTPAQAQARAQAHRAKLERDEQQRQALIQAVQASLEKSPPAPNKVALPTPGPAQKQTTTPTPTSALPVKEKEKPKEEIKEKAKEEIKETKETKKNEKLPGQIQSFQHLLPKIKPIQPADPFKLFSQKMSESSNHKNWESIPTHFKSQGTFLSLYKEQFPQEDVLHVMECGGGGDCLFHAIAQGLRTSGYPELANVSMQDIRNWAAEMLTLDNLPMFVQDWNQSKEKQMSLEEIQKRIRSCGNDYQGETGTLQFLLCHHPILKKYRLGFMVINLHSHRFRTPQPKTKKDRLIAQYFTDENTEFVMTLYCTGEHWLLAGVAVFPSLVTCFIPLASFPHVLTRLNEF